MFGNPEMEKVTKPKLDQVREVGKVYFETGKIPDSLLEDLAKPMIPNEQYISMINSVTL